MFLRSIFKHFFLSLIFSTVSSLTLVKSRPGMPMVLRTLSAHTVIQCLKGREWGKNTCRYPGKPFKGLKPPPAVLKRHLVPQLVPVTPHEGEVAMVRNQISIVSIPEFFFLLDFSFSLLTLTTIKTNNSFRQRYHLEKGVEIEAYIWAGL